MSKEFDKKTLAKEAFESFGAMDPNDESTQKEFCDKLEKMYEAQGLIVGADIDMENGVITIKTKSKS